MLNFIKFIKKIKILKDRKSRQNFYAFLICVVISAFIWTLIKTSKGYVKTVNYPITYINIPKDKILINKLDTVCSVSVRFNNISFFTKRKPIIVDLENLKLNKKRDIYEAFILTSRIIKKKSKQLYPSAHILSVSPDTLIFRYEDVVYKEVPVKLNISASFEKQYQLYDSIKYNPKNIILKGSKSELDKISSLETEKKDFYNLTKNQNFYIPILNPYKDGNLKIFPDKIKVFIPVEKYTEASITLPLNKINISEDYDIKIFPDKVNITYLIALKDYKKVSPDMFIASVNCSKIDKLNNKNLKVEISDYPDFVRITKIKPDKVEYIILK